MDPFAIAHFDSVKRSVILGRRSSGEGGGGELHVGKNIPVSVIPGPSVRIERPVLAGPPSLVVNQGSVFRECEVPGLSLFFLLFVVIFLLLLGIGIRGDPGSEAFGDQQ